MAAELWNFKVYPLKLPLVNKEEEIVLISKCDFGVIEGTVQN